LLTPFSELLAQRAEGTAVGAFTAYDLEATTATLRAAAAADTGVIILIGARSFADREGALLLAAVLAAAERSDARACVQLDHCADIAVIEAALAAGVGAVMADGSALAYDENVAFVALAVEIARGYGAAVEAELGAILGDEDIAEATAAGALTDPAEAVDFLARTGSHLLAVSIGNVHGMYRGSPNLDFERLSEIAAASPVPLSLHGASGIPDAMLQHAIATGIAKINVNTELRGAYLAATETHLPTVLNGSRLAALHAAQVDAVQAAVSDKLRAFDTRRDR
jgi:tagatose 1,6-diphosphate aldolase GatY/KbaY